MSNELMDSMGSVIAYLATERSHNTRKGYAADWNDSGWCTAAGLQSLPAEPATVARYLAQLADGGRKSSAIQRRVAAIRSAHKAAGLEPPTNSEGVKAIMRGIRRTLRSKPTRKKPTTAGLFSKVLEHLPNTLASVRDRAILLVGFAAALRRSELIALQLDEVEWRAGGVLIHLGHSKSYQEGKGTALLVPNGKKLRPSMLSTPGWRRRRSPPDPSSAKSIDTAASAPAHSPADPSRGSSSGLSRPRAWMRRGRLRHVGARGRRGSAQGQRPQPARQSRHARHL